MAPTKHDAVEVEVRSDGSIESPTLCFQIKKIGVQTGPGDDPPKEMEILGKMDFSIFPTFRGVEDKVLAIMGLGGKVRVFDEEDERSRPDFRINLLNFQQLCYNRAFATVSLPHDGYDIQFIPEFIQNPKGTDLRKFRITSSNYKIKGLNVNDILYQRKSWNDFKSIRLKTPRPRCPNVQLQRLFLAMQKHGYDSCSSLENSQSSSQNRDQQEVPGTPITVKRINGPLSPFFEESQIQNVNHDETPVAASTPKRNTDLTPSSPMSRRSSPTTRKKLVFEENNGQHQHQNGSEGQESEENTPDREMVPESPPISSPPTRAERPSPRNTAPTSFQEGEVDIRPKSVNLSLNFDLDIDPGTAQVSGDASLVVGEEPEPPGNQDENVNVVSETPANPGQTKSMDKSTTMTPPPVRRSPPKMCSKAVQTDSQELEQQDQNPDQPVAGHSRNLLRPDELPPRPPKKAVKPTTHRRIISSDSSDSDDEDNSANRNRKRKKSKSPSVPRISTLKKKARTSAAAPSNPVVVEDSEIEVNDSSSSSGSNHGSDLGRGNSANQRRPTTTPQKKQSGHPRGVPQARSYTPADCQHMLNLIARNNWGQYVKGNGVWEFVVNHKLLEHRIGFRTAKGLRDLFKKRILPTVEAMTAASTSGPFVISREDLKKFLRARKYAKEHHHSGDNEFPKYIQIQDVIRI